MTPSGFVARTSSSYVPFSRVKKTCGEEHGAHSAPLKAHSNVEPSWLEVNVKTAVSASLNAGGVNVNVVTGGGTTSKLISIGVGSAFSARSIARMRKVCGPTSSPSRDSGELHDVHGSKSSWHSYVSSSAGVALSTPPKTTSSGWVSDGGSNGISTTGGVLGPILARRRCVTNLLGGGLSGGNLPGVG